MRVCVWHYWLCCLSDVQPFVYYGLNMSVLTYFVLSTLLSVIGCTLLVIVNSIRHIVAVVFLCVELILE